MDVQISPEAASIALSYAERIVERMKSWSRSLLIALNEEIRFQTRDAHYEYAVTLISNFACLKTFFIRSEPVPLYDFYVPAKIKRADEKVINAAGFSDIERIGRRVVITGAGGAGKTIFMRHLLLNCLQESEKLPVFVELRDLKSEVDDIHDLVYRGLVANGLSIKRKFYQRLVEEGTIVFMLDGFDEIQQESRKRVEKQIAQLGRGTACSIFVSSRPDSRFQAWPDFSVAEIARLDLKDACKLIQKVPFDVGTKTKFTNELRLGLFAKHSSMLSNPLLLSIMLLTYSESASIPNRVTTFYQLAYEALFHRHDALKFGFERSRKTDLDINQFSALFSAFCLVTYDDRKFKFDHAYALASTERACKIANIKVDAASFVDDAREAVCLFIEEGLELSFTHRSFQEYFVAKFISTISGDKQQKLIEKYSKKNPGNLVFDRVLELLYEMNPQAVERIWLIPDLAGVFPEKKLKTPVSLATWYSVIKKSFRRLNLSEHSISIDSEISYDLINMLGFVARNCIAKDVWKREMDAEDHLEADDFTKKYLSMGIREIKVSDYGPTSVLMKELSRVQAAHSRLGVELARREYILMLQRARERNEELDAIFA